MTDTLNFLLEAPDPKEEHLARLRALILTDEQIVSKLLPQLDDPMLTAAEHSNIVDVLRQCGHDVSTLPGPVKVLRVMGMPVSPRLARSIAVISPGSITADRDQAPPQRPAAKPCAVTSPPAAPTPPTWRGIPLTPAQVAALKAIRIASGEVPE